jgi:hypothetical protein
MKGKTQRYYDANPEARKVKKKTDTKVNARPEQIKKRVESNKKRSEAKASGKNLRNKDYDHATNRFTSVKANRGRKGEGNR